MKKMFLLYTFTKKYMCHLFSQDIFRMRPSPENIFEMKYTYKMILFEYKCGVFFAFFSTAFSYSPHIFQSF